MDYTQDTTKHIKGKHFSYGDYTKLTRRQSQWTILKIPQNT